MQYSTAHNHSQQSPHEKLVLGTVQLGTRYGINNATGKPSRDEAFEILRTAHNGGITTIDTADAYGEAAEIIGAYHAIAEHEPFRIITKFHLEPESASMNHGEIVHNLQRKLAATRALLGVPMLWCYQYHRCSDVLQSPISTVVAAALTALKAEGAIEHIGVSVYSNDECEQASLFPHIDVIQVPFNLLDSMQFRGDAFRRAKEHGKHIHVRSVFLQGLFFKPAQEFSSLLAPLAPHVQRLRCIANDAGMSMEALALNYALHNPLIDAVLVGAERVEQLRGILAAVQTELSEDVRREVESETVEVESAYLLSPVNWS